MAEATALALLLRSRKRAVGAAVERGVDLAHAAEALLPEFRRAIIGARQLSRAAAITRLQKEAASLNVELGRYRTILAPQSAIDSYRATTTAKSYVKRWVRNAHGETLEEQAAAADTATFGSLKRIAVTESADSFNAAREAVIRRATTLDLWKIWDAVLDERTCDVCEGLHGTSVPAGQAFPDGDPPIHPWCRCHWQLVTRSEAESIDEAA